MRARWSGCQSNILNLMVGGVMKSRMLQIRSFIFKSIDAERRDQLSSLFKGGAVAIFLIAILAVIAPPQWRQSVMEVNVKFLILGFVLKIFYIFFCDRAKLHEIARKIVEAYASLEIEQKLYANAVLVTLAGLLILFAGGGPFVKMYFIILLAFYGYVVIYDVLRWYKAISDQLVGKAVIGITFAAASNFAYSLAGQKVAEVAHVTPTNFTHTVLFIAISTIPVLMIFSGGVIFSVGILMSSAIMLPFMFGNALHRVVEWLLAGTFKKSTLRFALITRLFQIFFYSTIGLAIFKWGERGMPWYDVEMSKATSWLIYNFDMYEGRECKVGADYKIAALGDAKFLIAKKSTSGVVSFEGPVKCDDLPAP
jgi:hypothetical protein